MTMTLGVLLALAALPPRPGAARGDPALVAMPERLEVRFALSALPPSLRDRAAVYVLDPARGYRLVRTGTNGQHCFVERTEWEYADFGNTVYYAICYDDAGAKSQMRLAFDVAALRAKGLSADALRQEIQRRMAAGMYPPPARAGFSYMVAPVMRAHVAMDVNNKTVGTIPLPHLMYYAPNVSDSAVGGIAPPSEYPFVRQPGPLGLFIQRLGEAETREILSRESALVRDLCSYTSDLCISGGAAAQ